MIDKLDTYCRTDILSWDLLYRAIETCCVYRIFMMSPYIEYSIYAAFTSVRLDKGTQAAA